MSLSDYRALYRKWRPRDFDDVCGQDGITDILKYEVANNRLSHAYLFCGSRGTGKTSCAKILAKAVNCENPRNGNPCNCCESCKSIDSGIATDVIEMDAASNNGINDVRDMQDEIAFTPALLKYRVYIIDEVHMMSGQAFNALLKTLEEPPTYVAFILATTEYHKLPTTIVSRCQRFDFKRISTDVIMSRLLEISKNEGIDITEDAARVIARVSRGGMRDAISLLELCAGANTKIDDAEEPQVFEDIIRANVLDYTFSFSGLTLTLWSIIYWCLLFMEMKFIWTYAKRLLMIGFLIVISPLITITYSIDKAGDGKAQAFSIWFNELVTNILIQPLHAIIYLIFVVTANNIAAESPIIALAFLMAMGTVEKTVKTVFNMKSITLKGLGEVKFFGKGK